MVIPYPYHLRLVCFRFYTTWHTMKLVGEMCQVIFHDYLNAVNERHLLMLLILSNKIYTCM